MRAGSTAADQRGAAPALRRAPRGRRRPAPRGVAGRAGARLGRRSRSRRTSSYDKTINTGRGLHPVRMVSDVTVSPTHRRRGLLRRADHRGPARRGRAGPATGGPHRVGGLDLRTVRLRAGRLPARRRGRHGPRFALRGAGGRRLGASSLEPAEAWPTVAAVFARFHERTRGSVDRPHFYEPILTGEFDFDEWPRQEAPHRRAPRRGRLARRVRRLSARSAQGRPPRGQRERPRGADAGGVPPAVAVPRRRRPQRLRGVGPGAGRRPARLGAGRPVPRPGEEARPTRSGCGCWTWPPRWRPGRGDATERSSSRSTTRSATRPGGSGSPRPTAARRWWPPTTTPAYGSPRRRSARSTSAGCGADTLRRAGRLAGSADALDTWAAMVDGGPVPYCLTGF